MAAERKDKKNAKRWFLDIGNQHGSAVARLQSDLPAPFSYVKPGQVEYSERNKEVDPELVVKRAWDIGLAPIKQVPMNLFVMWMAGNSISMFPIMMVGMMAVRPIQALMTMGQTFKMIEGPQAPLQKLAWVAGNLVGVLLAVYKCNSMGLLPTHASDWLAFAEDPVRVEYVAGGLSFQ